MDRPRSDPDAAPSLRRAGGSRGRATVTRLMDAARGAIAARGVTGMRIDDVAQRAGTSHGTLYLYFEDKDDLLDALMVDCEHELRVLAKRAPSITPAQRRSITTWTSAVIQTVQRHRPSIQAALGSRPDFDLAELARPLRTAVIDNLATHDHLSPEAVVDAWVGMVMWHGLADVTTDRGAEVAGELLLRGVMPMPDAPAGSPDRG